MALPSALITAPANTGAAFAARVTPAAQKRRQFDQGMKRITARNRSNMASMGVQTDAAGNQVTPAPAAPSVQVPGAAGPALGAAPPAVGVGQLAPQNAGPPAGAEADPYAAFDQFAADELGGAEFRINRRRPASRPPRATAGKYRGQTVNQARQAVESAWPTLGNEQKQAAFDKSQSQQFLPGNTPASPAASPFAPQMKNLKAPQRATGDPLGGNQFTRLQHQLPVPV